MTAKEFLQQAYIAHGEVEMKLEEMARLQALATRTTTTIRAVPGKNGNGEYISNIERAVISLERQVEQLANEVSNLLEIGRVVAQAISRVKSPAARKILEYRYLCFFSWKQISLLLKTSSRRVYQLHEEALKNFSVDCSRLQ